MVAAILILFFLVVSALLSVVVLHLGCFALARLVGVAKSTMVLALTLAMLVAVGSVGLWKAMESLFAAGYSAGSLPQSIKVAAVSLYLAGCVVYLELRSLVSRGYSLRILVDLLRRGGAASVESLKLGYGDGVGIEGMLGRRLATLAKLHLLWLRGDLVGPLTRFGKIFATMSLWMRQLLRLEVVG